MGKISSQLDVMSYSVLLPLSGIAEPPPLFKSNSEGQHVRSKEPAEYGEVVKAGLPLGAVDLSTHKVGNQPLSHHPLNPLLPRRREHSENFAQPLQHGDSISHIPDVILSNYLPHPEPPGLAASREYPILLSILDLSYPKPSRWATRYRLPTEPSPE